MIALSRQINTQYNTILSVEQLFNSGKNETLKFSFMLIDVIVHYMICHSDASKCNILRSENSLALSTQRCANKIGHTVSSIRMHALTHTDPFSRRIWYADLD